MAEGGSAELWTSTFTLAEVWKTGRDGENAGLPGSQDGNFENYILSGFVKLINVDEDVGTLARRLLREHPGLGKPQDAVHAASALIANVDEMHTFDEKDLLNFSGKLGRGNGVELIICKPPDTGAFIF